jgi:hypothetical protein
VLQNRQPDEICIQVDGTPEGSAGAKPKFVTYILFQVSAELNYLYLVGTVYLLFPGTVTQPLHTGRAFFRFQPLGHCNWSQHDLLHHLLTKNLALEMDLKINVAGEFMTFG